MRKDKPNTTENDQKPHPMKTIRIFISSPADVAVERGKARKVVEGLQRRYAGRLRLETVLWEDLPLGADKSFQAGIDQAIVGTESSFQKSVDLLLSEKHCVDVAVFILWSRLGSPLGVAIRKPDGTPYRSGTEREFDLMLAARAQSPDKIPEILVYVRQDDRRFKAALQETPTDKIEEMIRQHRLAEQFIREQFHDADTGSNLRAYHTFPEPNSFAERLKTHLRNLLDGIVMDGGLGFGTWEGSPYRGLEVFRSEHAPIFFGRDEEVCEVLERLRTQAAAGCAFLLLVGASGSGKSSLARAGVLPALETDNPDDSVAEWRSAALTPGECADGLCRGLARTLLDRIPELRGDDDSLDDLEQALRDGQGKALSLLLKRACAGNPATAGGGPIRLVLLVDQLEELFTHPAITEAEAAASLAALQALAVTGCVWVLATVRSDFYDRCQRFPVLMAMKGERGQIDLLPPEPSDIHRIITGPAMLAGVGFEKNPGGESLDQRILNDAVGHPEALPLLEFTLAQLYEARTAEGSLTFAAYDKLGGVEGAIGRHAEAVFAAQPEPVRSAFGPVFQALVALDETDEARPVRRRVALNTLAATPERSQLAEALLAARLLSSDRGEVFVAHEALLRRWERAVQWIEANRDRLRVRDRIAARMTEGAPLAENDPLTSLARHHLAEHPDTFDPAQRDYIATQLAQLDAARKRRERVRRAVVAGLSVLTLIAIAGAIFGWYQARVAKSETARAEAALIESGQTKADLQFERGRIVLEQARTADGNGDNLTSVLLAGKAIGFRGYGWEEAPHALQARFPALLGQPLKQHSTADAQRQSEHAAATGLIDSPRRAFLPCWLRMHKYQVSCVAFSPDCTRLASGSWDETVKLWDAATGKLLATLTGHNESVYCVSYSPDGTRLASGSGDNTAKLWDAATGKELATLIGHMSYINSVAFSPDGTRLASGSDDNTVRIWDVATGKELATLTGHQRSVNSVAFSPNGTRLASGSGDITVKLWDATSGKELATLAGHQGSVNSVAFSPNGMRLASGSDDKTVKLWDAATGKEIAVLTGHEGDVSSVAFSPDGTRLAIGCSDANVKLWDAATAKELALLTMGRRGRVGSVAFSPDGTRLASGTYDAFVILWDAAPPNELAALAGHEGEIRSVAFSPDGTLLASGAADRIVKLWDAATGKELATFTGHDEYAVKSVAFSRDGKRLASGSYDKNVKLWDVASGKKLECEPDFVFPLGSDDGYATSSDDQLSAVVDGSVIRISSTSPRRPNLFYFFQQGLLELEGREVMWKTDLTPATVNAIPVIHYRDDPLAGLVDPYLLPMREAALRLPLALMARASQWRPATAYWAGLLKNSPALCDDPALRQDYLSVLLTSALNPLATQSPDTFGKLVPEITAALTPQAVAAPRISLPLAQVILSLAATEPSLAPQSDFEALLKRTAATAAPAWKQALSEMAQQRLDASETPAAVKPRLVTIIRLLAPGHEED